MPTKSSGDAIVFSSSSVNSGPPPVSARYSSVYFPSSLTVMKPAFPSRVALSAASMCSRASMTGTATRMLSANPTSYRPARWRGSTGREAVGKHRVVPDLLQLPVREPQAWGGSELDRLAADLHVDDVVAAVRERPELTDREEVLDAVAELLRH